MNLLKAIRNTFKGASTGTLVTDPICNMQVDLTKTKFKSVHNGKEYGFCNPACKTEFDQNPEKYV